MILLEQFWIRFVVGYMSPSEIFFLFSHKDLDMAKILYLRFRDTSKPLQSFSGYPKAFFFITAALL